MKRAVLIVAAVALLLGILAAGVSYAWFRVESGGVPDVGLGSIELALDYEPELADGEGGFVLENTGTLGAHVRLWYSFQYMDGEQPLMRDVSGIRFAEFVLERDGEAQPYEFATLTHRAGGFAQDKTFLLVLAEEGDGAYLRLEPGETLTARFRLEGSEGPLRITWVAEAMQASGAALADGTEYGWDAARAGS